jgi:hypothetical protein
MNYLAYLLLLLIPVYGYSQTSINKTIPMAKGQSLNMHFDYPNNIRVTTWDKDEVLITGTVSINAGENDDAFDLESSTATDELSISSRIKNFKQLPSRMAVFQDGKKLIFHSKEEYREYCRQQGRDFKVLSWGVDMEIQLEIKVPRNVKTQIQATYGMVEVVNFEGPLVVDATYGGIDASLNETQTGELSAETNYGQIYSNLSTHFSGENFREESFHTLIKAQPGKGPAYRFESKYGNVYLRKI